MTAINHHIVVTVPQQEPGPAILRRVEVCAAFLILFNLTAGILPLLLHGSADDVAYSDYTPMLERIIYWCFYAFTATQVMLRPGDFIRCASKVPFAMAMVLLALLSASWSLDPSTTLRRTFTLGMVTVFGVYLALRFCPRDLLRLVAGVLGTCAVLSAVFGLLLPSYGIAHGANDGSWQGIFNQKNVLGMMMLFTAVIFRSVPSRLLGWIGVAAAVLLLALSGSINSLLVLGTVVMTMPLLRRYRQKRLRSGLVVIALYVFCITALLMNVDRDVGVKMLGKDPTLTGRTEIWSAAMDRIVERPLLGHGYAAFWLHTRGPGERVRQVVQWDTPNSHNVFLDFGADLGLLGVLTLIGALAHAGHRVWKLWRPELGTSDDWFLAILLSIVLIGVAQSSFYSNSFAWALLVAAAAAKLDGLPNLTRTP